MSDAVLLRKIGCAGRITLNRPETLNALSHQMCLKIEAALDLWLLDDVVKLVIIDAAGDRAFCAGGDIAAMYHAGIAGEFDSAKEFWTDEYRLNAKIFNFPKPYVSFMQGYTMGGGVGVGCLGSHRVVGKTTKLAMPECGIGLIPDVGGTLLLARAPGYVGEYLGVTGARMGAADAIFAGFADHYVPEKAWPELINLLETDGDVRQIRSDTVPVGNLEALQNEIDEHFSGGTIEDILVSLQTDTSSFVNETLATLLRQSPISAACTVQLIHLARKSGDIKNALKNEFRFTSRAAEQGDFLEGVRAAVIDKDRTPKWQHNSLENVSSEEVAFMLSSLGDAELNI